MSQAEDAKADSPSPRMGGVVKPNLLAYGLIAAAILGILMSFTSAQGYVPQAGLVWNMQHAGLFPQRIQVSSVLTGGTFAQHYKTTYGVSLGTALTICVAIGLAGLGVLLFVGRQKPEK